MIFMRLPRFSIDIGIEECITISGTQLITFNGRALKCLKRISLSTLLNSSPLDKR